MENEQVMKEKAVVVWKIISIWKQIFQMPTAFSFAQATSQRLFNAVCAPPASRHVVHKLQLEPEQEAEYPNTLRW